MNRFNWLNDLNFKLLHEVSEVSLDIYFWFLRYDVMLL